MAHLLGVGGVLPFETAEENSAPHNKAKLPSRERIEGSQGEIRVFYDVTDTEVHVLAIVSKAEAEAWLDEQGISAPPGGPGKGEG